MNRKIRLYGLMLLILSLLFSSSIISYAKNDGNKDNKGSTKRIIVKYKDNNQNVDNNINGKKRDGKFKKYRQLNKKRLYSFEIDLSQMDSYVKDKDIELVEEDTAIQMFSESVADNSGNLCKDCHCNVCEHCGTDGCSNCTEENCSECLENNCPDCSGVDQKPEEIIYTPPQIDPLPTDENASYNSLGDKLNWNILRTGADKLQDMNVKGDGIKVAVFDTGISLVNSDLKVAGGISFVEGVTGYDDDNGHGTAMAGIIAASLDGKGLAGMAPNAQLYAVKVLDKDGYGRYSGIIQGIQWAIENDMDIISLSLGGLQYSQILKDAIDQAVGSGILVVAAAGNNNSGQVMYPGAYSQVVCVGATNSDNTKGVYSNYGSQVDISAPGSNVETTGLNNTTAVVTGTSPAAAHITGAAALLWSQNKTLTNGHIKYLLYHNAYDLGDYSSFGHGLLDVKKAYENLQNGYYDIYVSDGTEEGHYVEDAVGEGWDGVVYGQACSHVFNIVDQQVAASCTNSGFIVFRCSKCGATSKQTISALGHNYVKSSSVAATCTKDGSVTYKCSRCTASYTNTLSATGHSYKVTSTKDATCTEDGYTKYTCSNCSGTKTETIPKTGHTFKEYMTSMANCTEEGYTLYKCSKCGVTEKRNIIPKTPHDYTYKVTTVNATCTTAGSITRKCSCGASQTETIPVLGHNMYSVYEDSTCTASGRSGQQCSRCSYNTIVSIPPKGHAYSSSVSSAHTSSGHYYRDYCSRCGATFSSGYTTLSTCLSCTTPPSVSFYNINGNTILSESQTNYIIQIRVIDNENDSLTCNYYLDGSSSSSGTVTATNTQGGTVVSFPAGINASSLAEGNHTLRATVKDAIAPLGETSITFKVDKTVPAISGVTVEPTSSTVRFTVTATDAISGLAPTAYRYTIDGAASDWIAGNTFTKSDLIPNTTHTYKAEVRDNVGHITTASGNFTTKLDKPIVNVTSLPCESFRVVIKDSNPAGTLYAVQVGSGYANGNGGFSASLLWIQPVYDSSYGGKVVIVNGLQSGIQYTIAVTAKNTASTENITANSVMANTSPTGPKNLKASDITSSTINLMWSAANGASTYDICRETLSAEGTVTATKNITGVLGTFYQDKDVLPGSNYRYKLRSVDQYGNYGSWSTESVTAITKPLPPAKVNDPSPEIKGSELSITWDAVSSAVGYEAEITCDGKVITKRTKETKLTFDTGSFNSQCDIRIRAFNVCSEENQDDTALWSNEGPWSSIITSYTYAEMPALKEIKAEDITADSIKVIWDRGHNPLSVEYKLIVFENGQPVKETIYMNSTEYLVTGLKADTQYTFKVKARNLKQIETEWSNEVPAKTLANVPKIPQRLRATAKEEGIVLSWDASEGALSYRILRNGTILADNLLETTYVDSNLVLEENYTYAVLAVNASGESEYSQPLSKKALGEVPKAPVIRVISSGSISITIDWNAIDNVTGYELEVDGKVKNMGLGTTFEHVGLVPGSEHTYRVRARNTYGKSKWSEAVAQRTDDIAPATPGNLSAIASENQIYIHWSNTENVNYYELSVDDTIVGNITASEYLLTLGTGDNALHQIKVRSVNEGGCSDWSGTVTAALDVGGGSIPQIEVPATPDLSTQLNASGITVTWSNTERAASYQLEADDNVLYDGPATKFNHRPLEAGSIHTYRVRAGNISGFSEWSEPIAVTSGAITYTPSNINYIRQEERKTQLTWDAVNGTQSYLVEVNGVSGEATDKTSAVIATEPGKVYRVRIAAVTKDAEGSDYYDWSDEISFTAARALPKAPGIKEVKAGLDNISITLVAVNEATGYEIEIDGEIVDAGNNLTILQSGLTPSKSYEYRVRSYNEAGEGEWSKSYTLMTGETLPGVPLNITAEAAKPSASSTGSAITLKWNNVEGANSYQIEDENKILYNTAENQITIENLTPGVPHYFHIRAIKAEEEGAWSSLIRVIPSVTAPENAAVYVGENAVRITWDQVSGATFYEVEINGVLAGITEENYMDFAYPVFYMERNVRIRACQGEQKGSWSDSISYKSPLPVKVNLEEGEEFSCLLPVQNVKDVGNYKLSLTFDNNDLELIDGCELTKAKETESCYINEIHTRMLIETEGSKTTVTFLLDGKEGSNFTGNAGSLRFRSKVGAEVTLTYGVTLK